MNLLGPGDVFRDWLVGILDDRIKNKGCSVDVLKYASTSHNVCRYRFIGEDYSVIAKFFAEPLGELKEYDAYRAMMAEYNNLHKAGQFINVAKPIAVRSDFNCVLVTEYIKGKKLLWHLKHRESLYDVLSSIARMLRDLHDNTRSHYDKGKEFANFHYLLDQLRIERNIRKSFDEMLGRWWYSSLLDREQGCMIHRDTSPLNYIVANDIPYILDMESCWHHANPIRDIGTLCAEMKNYFQLNCGSGMNAEPYIGHFLWHYCRSEDEFHKNTMILPFFMSIGLLRTARLYRHSPYNQYLLKEALSCLKAIE
ncbi:MAG: phosphotransferase [Methanolobus sp.]|nr:phosphotransferase [Methanolobus sp.]